MKKFRGNYTNSQFLDNAFPHFFYGYFSLPFISPSFPERSAPVLSPISASFSAGRGAHERARVYERRKERNVRARSPQTRVSVAFTTRHEKTRNFYRPLAGARHGAPEETPLRAQRKPARQTISRCERGCTYTHTRKQARSQKGHERARIY